MIEDCEKNCEYWHDASAGVYAWEWCSFPDGEFVSYIHDLKCCPRWKERIAALEARHKALVEAGREFLKAFWEPDNVKAVYLMRDAERKLRAALDAAEGEGAGGSRGHQAGARER